MTMLLMTIAHHNDHNRSCASRQHMQDVRQSQTTDSLCVHNVNSKHGFSNAVCYS